MEGSRAQIAATAHRRQKSPRGDRSTPLRRYVRTHFAATPRRAPCAPHPRSFRACPSPCVLTDAPQAWIRLWEAPCRRAGRSGRCIRKMESEACANGRLLPRKMASEACADGRPHPGRAGASPVGTRKAGDQQLQVLRSREEGRHNEEGAIPPLNTPQCRRDAQQYPVYRPASPRRRKGAGSARQASAPVCRAHAIFTQ